MEKYENAIEYAAKYGHLEIAKFLIENGKCCSYKTVSLSLSGSQMSCKIKVSEYLKKYL